MHILCIIDGMGDEGFSFSRMPTLRQAAREGAWGLFDTVPRGMSPETLPCTLSLLGVPEELIPRFGRGAAEALGAGLCPEPEDLILRGSWVSLDRKGRVTGFARPPEKLPDGVFPLEGYRSLILLKGAAGDAAGLVVFPPHDAFGALWEELSPRGEGVLPGLFASWREGDRALIPWGASSGRLPEFSRPGTAVAAAGVVKGAARALGMKLICPRGATGETDTDLFAKLAAAEQAEEAGESFCLLHVGGADEAAHRKDAREKAEFLRRVERELLPGLFVPGRRVLLCADHGSSPGTGAHLSTPQPFVLFGGARRGNLGLLPGGRAISLLEEEIWPGLS